MTSGWLASIDLAIVFITVVLPAFGGDTMMPRWPLPIGHTRSMIRAVMLVGSRRVLEAQPLVREQRREVLEPGPPLGRFRVAAVDGVDLEQRRVLLVAAGRPADAGDVVALAQAVLAGQLHRDVGVVAARQVALHPQEAIALVAHVQVAGHLDQLADRSGRRLAGLLHRGVVALRAVDAAAGATLAPTTTAAVAALAVVLAATLLAAALLAAALLTAGGAIRAPFGGVGGAGRRGRRADEPVAGGDRGVVGRCRRGGVVAERQLPLGGRLVVLDDRCRVVGGASWWGRRRSPRRAAASITSTGTGTATSSISSTATAVSPFVPLPFTAATAGAASPLPRARRPSSPGSDR